MTTVSAASAIAECELDTIAWEFLCSPYTSQTYWDWSLERRLDAYLRHQDRADVLNNGAAYATVLDRVMANLSRARRHGKLSPPQI
ncbi:hypothetical protein FHT40_004115 [Mycolicibacterium sp. BK556]|uniref:hypothetical protein n=1 Tax=Mycobacteriaceae TaxID=1762 RepID=UPI00105C8D97|nr:MULTISPECIES: hypothetical protein [Mycobacteriaceae]MBB3604437.1 hypothetical protein [Mycolicibacterium sp. BK556]MBB3634850.1 hypothetical protein [Mycolicibacterium sp. BK607]MBB3752719.1 hypothetical protein [Mycolicibacterium sp. BK634]TDO17344.1 hypothetical protein EV580_0511 [Mycobacterium sp. BK086]